MKSIIIGACSDLGVHVDGSNLGPTKLLNDLISFTTVENTTIKSDSNVIKSRSLADKRKNVSELIDYNTKLYNSIINYVNEDYFPITIGGDHSVSIASALAVNSIKGPIGLIHFGGFADYNTFDTTISGNINGLTNAAINNYHTDYLTSFHDKDYILPENTVIIGVRDLPAKERENLKYSHVTYFSSDDIKNLGIKEIINQTLEIVTHKTNGFHVSFDIGIIDDDYAPGVSTFLDNGITPEIALDIITEITNNINLLTSFDLVEFNPVLDVDRKTEQIAVNIIAKLLKDLEKKEKTTV